MANEKDANFTPELGNYRSLQPFRFWCQKVLPLVYDDSLSYYELLCKVVDYLNKTMEDVETLHGDVTGLHEAYVKLQGYVNDYFNNLDVQVEINNKLDVMANDGTLSSIVSNFIQVSPIFVDDIHKMTDGEKVYVLTSNGHLYANINGSFKDTGIAYGINGIYPKYVDSSTWSNAVLQPQSLESVSGFTTNFGDTKIFDNGTFSGYPNVTRDGTLFVRYKLTNDITVDSINDFGVFVETKSNNVSIRLCENDVSGQHPYIALTASKSGFYIFDRQVKDTPFTAKYIFVQITGGTNDDFNSTKVTLIKGFAKLNEWVDEKINKKTYPNDIDFNSWGNNVLEKQAISSSLGYVLNHGYSDYKGYKNGVFSGYPNITRDGTLFVRYKLTNDITVDSINDFGVFVETKSNNVSIRLCENDVSGQHPYIALTASKSGFYIFDRQVKDTPFTAKYIFVQITGGTNDDFNSTKVTLIKGFAKLNEWVDEKIAYTPPKTKLVCIGDSLTAGDGGGGTNYPNLIAKHFDWDVINFGVSGESPSSIAYRCKSNVMYIPANTNPANYFTPDFLSGRINVYPNISNKTFNVIVEEEKHIATKNGITIKIDGVSTKNYPRAITYDYSSNGDIYILWIGTNSDRAFDSISPYLDAIISNKNNKYIVVGLTVDSADNAISILNSELQNKYHEHFINLKELLVEYGLNIMNLTPTTIDTERINAGNVPASLLATDLLHFNSNGYKAISKFLIDRIVALGYN